MTSLRKPDACRTLAAGDGSAHVGGDDRDRLRGLAERREGGEGGGNLHGRRSNGVTASLGLDGADLVVEELAELPLHELLVRF